VRYCAGSGVEVIFHHGTVFSFDEKACAQETLLGVQNLLCLAPLDLHSSAATVCIGTALANKDTHPSLLAYRTGTHHATASFGNRSALCASVGANQV